MIISVSNHADRIRLIAIEMKGAFGNEGALPLLRIIVILEPAQRGEGSLILSGIGAVREQKQ